MVSHWRNKPASVDDKLMQCGMGAAVPIGELEMNTGVAEERSEQRKRAKGAYEVRLRISSSSALWPGGK
jgi:hypothetical protein